MYQSYFGLAEAPFSIAPAPRYLYMSPRHQEALAHLLYGINSGGGFVLLTGEVGTGKTTVCRCLLEQIPESCDVAYIFNPRLTVPELLSSLCVEFGIAFPEGNDSVKVFVDCINAHLLEGHARGRHAVLIIDEAQNLAPDVLEQMRLLTNLETSERKLLQIMLIGQPELLTMLARPDLRQLAQRIVARFHLGPLDRAEVGTYVRHRLEVAGSQRPLFPPALMGRLHQLSGGVPRLINVLCDRALLGAYAQGKDAVDAATLTQAAREVLPTATPARRWRQPAFVAAALLVVSLGIGWVSLNSRAPVPFTPAEEVVPRAPTAQAAVAPEALPDHLSWPADVPRSQGDSLAHGALFQAWGLAYRDGAPCSQAEAERLFCRDEYGGLDHLRGLNLPAILFLRDQARGAFTATLLHLDEHSATLVVGGQTQRVSLAVLAQQWEGQFRLLWRSPPSLQGTLRPGDRNEGVAWLDRQLARVQGVQPRSVEGEAMLFDDAIAGRLRQYQLDQGLIPDGSAGPQTLIRLISATDPEVPKLNGPPSAVEVR